jgi:GMP synthase (glutamine-hydrolysing)
LKKICIIKTGTVPECIRKEHGDFHRFFLTAMKLSAREVEVITDFKTPQFPFPKTCGVIITGSPANVTDQEPWMNILAGWIRELIERKIPVLGVCFGHQIIAHALGGKVEYHPQGMEIGSVPIQLTPEGCSDTLLGKMPMNFSAMEIHSQTVALLPSGAKVLARNEFEPHQAVAYVENLVWGLQFHPEFTKKFMRSYIEKNAEELESKGFIISELLRKLDEDSHTSQPLEEFVDFCFTRIEAKIS